MALVVPSGGLIWEFLENSSIADGEKTISRSASFWQAVDSGRWGGCWGGARSSSPGQEISAPPRGNDHFQLFVPAQFDGGLVNKVIEKRRSGHRQGTGTVRFPGGGTISTRGAVPWLIIGFWVFSSCGQIDEEAAQQRRCRSGQEQASCSSFLSGRKSTFKGGGAGC